MNKRRVIAGLLAGLSLLIVQGLRAQSGLRLLHRYNANLTDHSGFGNNGQAQGSIGFRPDRFGFADSALRLPGNTGDFVRIPAAGSLQSPFTQNFGIIVWIKPDSGATVLPIISNRTGANQPQVSLKLIRTARGGYYKFQYAVGAVLTTYDIPSPADSLNNAQWVPIAVGFQTTSSLPLRSIVRLFRAGKKLGEFSNPLTGVTSAARDWQVGQDDSAGIRQNFQGRIDDLRLVGNNGLRDTALRRYTAIPYIRSTSTTACTQGNTTLDVILDSLPAGYTVRWYRRHTDARSAALATGFSFSTGTLTRDTVFYVSLDTAGREGPRIAVPVRVNAATSLPRDWNDGKPRPDSLNRDQLRAYLFTGNLEDSSTLAGPTGTSLNTTFGLNRCNEPGRSLAFSPTLAQNSWGRVANPLASGTNFTVATYVKLDSLPRTAGRRFTVWSTIDPAAPGNSGYEVRIDTGGIVRFLVPGGPLGQHDTLTSPIRIRAGAWVVVSACFDGDTARLFVGLTQAKKAVNFPSIAQNANPIQLGGYAVAPGNVLRGQIDEFRVYNTVLNRRRVELIAYNYCPVIMPFSNTQCEDLVQTLGIGNLDSNTVYSAGNPAIGIPFTAWQAPTNDTLGIFLSFRTPYSLTRDSVETFFVRARDTLTGCEIVFSQTYQVTWQPSPNGIPSITLSTNTTCIGSAITATVSPADYATRFRIGSVLWSNGATTPTTQITSGTQVTLTYFGLTGACAKTIAVPVTFVPPPTAPVLTSAANSTVLCQPGGSLLLTATTPSAPVAGYRWYGPTPSDSLRTTSNTRTITQPGTYSVRAFVVARPGDTCRSPLSNALVITPVAIPAQPNLSQTGNAGICTGQNLTLTANPNNLGAGNYQWFNGTTLLTGETNASLTVSTAGRYKVLVRNAAGCFSPASDSLILRVDPVPATPVIELNGSDSLCPRTTTQVRVRPPLATGTYLWSNGATGTSITVGPGTYSVINTAAAGTCPSPSSNVITVVRRDTLTQRPLLVGATRDTLCGDGTATLRTQFPLADGKTYRFRWFRLPLVGGGATQVATVPVITPTTTGRYFVQVDVNANFNCSRLSDTVVVLAVPPQPTITSSLSRDTLCAGETVTLTAPAGFAAYRWNTGATTRSITVGPGLYSVQVANALAGSALRCPSAVSATYQVFAAASFTPPVLQTATGGALPDTLRLCQGTPSTIRVSNSESRVRFKWFRVGSSTVLGTERTLTVSTAGRYFCRVFLPTLTAANGELCARNSDTLVVEVISLPTITLPDTLRSCVTAITLSPTIGGGQPTDTYQWFRNGALQPGTANTFSATVTGQYVFRINRRGCSVNDTVEVFIFPNPDTTVIVGAQPWCEGNGVALTGIQQVGNTYQWFRNDTLITGATSRIYTATRDGNYVLRVTNTLGCVLRSAPKRITFIPLPPAEITNGALVTLCGTTSSDTLRARFDARITDYRWFRVPNTLVQSGPTAQYIVNQPGRYYLVVTGPGPCARRSDTVEVQRINAPVAQIPGPSRREACQGVEIRLQAAPVAGQAITYQWQRNGQPIPGATSDTYLPTSNGLYTVRVANFGCGTVSNTVEVSFFPAPEVNLGRDTVICQTLPLVLKGPNGMRSYRWQDGSTEASLTVTSPGTYTLEVFDARGCRGAGLINVGVEECEPQVYFPDAFSPNGNGQNETWTLQANNVSEFELRIFNRWGVQVFYSNSLTDSWDGQVSGGEAPSGDYTWVCKYSGRYRGRTVSKTANGIVHLLR